MVWLLMQPVNQSSDCSMLKFYTLFICQTEWVCVLQSCVNIMVLYHLPFTIKDEHMFLHCEAINEFWDKVLITIFLFINLHFDRSDISMMFGFAYNSKIRKIKTNIIANHILLISKLCVSKMRYGESTNINLIFESELSLREKCLRNRKKPTNN